jgi:hypothetical protein
MKHLGVLVFVIGAAAVLVAAYAVGLLVRQARMPDVEPPSQEMAEPNTVTSEDALAANRRIGRRSGELTEEEKAAARRQRAEELAGMQNLTEEEKQQFRDKISRQFTRGTDRRSQAGPIRMNQERPGTQAATADVNDSPQTKAAGKETAEPNEGD